MKHPLTPSEEPRSKSGQERYVFRLFVAGHTRQSLQAVANLKDLCAEHLKDRYELTVIDLYQHPERAKGEQVLCAPTLVKELPLPLRRLIGDLSNRPRALLALGIHREKPQ